MTIAPLWENEWQRIDVLLVDDHSMIRVMLQRLLEEHTKDTGIRVVGSAASGEEALQKLPQLRPDVVIMDINMPGMGGMEATRRALKALPGVKVIMLTVLEDGPYPHWLLDSGASGYLSKGCDIDEIVQAIHMAMQGERYLSPPIAARLALRRALPMQSSAMLCELSARERQVLVMLVEGHKASVISRRLNLSQKTVSTYKQRLLEKLDCRTEMDLFRLAVQTGLTQCVTEPMSQSQCQAE